MNTTNRNIMLLDCTLRDGGQLLEEKNRLEGLNYSFDEKESKLFASLIAKSNIEIVELGTVEFADHSKKEYNLFNNMKELSDNVPIVKNSRTKYSVFFSSHDIPINEIPEKKDTKIDLIRISIRYSQMDKSLEYCAQLIEKGYLVSIQPIVTIRYTDKDLEKIYSAANQMNAYSVYIVDSYGSMDVQKTRDLFDDYDKHLNSKIKIGLHSHYNLCMSIANTIDYINISQHRDILLDSCCMGMGKGAGNLQTEVIVNYLNRNYFKNYDLISVLKACEYLNDYNSRNLWGYSVETMICGFYGAAYKYGNILRYKYNYSYDKIAYLISKLSDEARFRYSDEYVDNIIKEYG